MGMDDATAIERCRQGDRDAFSWLVRRYQAEAIGHALTILNDREDALDAVQEAFLRAFRSIGRFRIGRAFYPWLYTILRNRCYALLRRRGRDKAGGGEPILSATDEHGPLHRPRAVSRSQDQNELLRLEAALAAVSPADRELITLKHLDGLRYAEIAERLGVPPGTVMSRLYHARRRLRAEIERRRLEDGESEG